MPSVVAGLTIAPGQCKRGPDCRASGRLLVLPGKVDRYRQVGAFGRGTTLARLPGCRLNSASAFA
jgi:hypothetical protein